MGAPLLHVIPGRNHIGDMTELLRRAVALMLDKLNEHNPKTSHLPLGPSTTD